MESWRRVDNVQHGESMVFVETAEETGGERLVVEVEVAPGGGPALHSHAQQETFELLSGTVEIRHGESRRLLESGAPVTVPPGDLHCFTNVGDDAATIRVTVVPPMDFERTMRVLTGLARDGRLGKMGERPPEPALMAAICKVADFYMPPMPRPLWTLMNTVLAPFGRRALREAVALYDRPRPSPGERVGQLTGRGAVTEG